MDAYESILDDAINEIVDETKVKFRIPVGKPADRTQQKTIDIRDSRAKPETSQYEDARIHPQYHRMEAMDQQRRYQHEHEKPDGRYEDHRGTSYNQTDESKRAEYNRRYYYEGEQQPSVRRENLYDDLEMSGLRQTMEGREEAYPSKPNAENFKRGDYAAFQSQRQPRDREHYPSYENYPTQRQTMGSQSYKKEKTGFVEQMCDNGIPDTSTVRLPKIVPRAQWGALPSLRRIDSFTSPADTLVFSFDTQTPACHTEDECRRTVRELQARYMGKGLADIKHNFLVGGDGNMYEGRGWALQSGVPNLSHEGHNYCIGLIGQHLDPSAIPANMVTAVQNWIDYAKAHKIIVRPPGQLEGNKRMDNS